MAHLERDDLALRAIGEPVGSPHDEEHLLTCEACREDLETMTAVADIATDLAPEERTLSPAPPSLFDRIEEELGVDEPTSSNAFSLAGVRSRTWGVVTAAAAVVALALFGMSTLADLGPTQETVASVTLEPLDDRVERAQAQLVDVDGELVLRFAGEGLPEADGYYELWLIDEAVSGMVSLGPVDGQRGHRVPPGLDPLDFPIVDVSLEPLDGDPTHSGDSLLRGRFDLDA